MDRPLYSLPLCPNPLLVTERVGRVGGDLTDLGWGFPNHKDVRGDNEKHQSVRKCIWQEDPRLVLLWLPKRTNGGRLVLPICSEGLLVWWRTARPQERVLTCVPTSMWQMHCYSAQSFYSSLFRSGSLYCGIVKKNNLVIPAFDWVYPSCF